MAVTQSEKAGKQVDMCCGWQSLFSSSVQWLCMRNDTRRVLEGSFEIMPFEC